MKFLFKILTKLVDITCASEGLHDRALELLQSMKSKDIKASLCHEWATAATKPTKTVKNWSLWTLKNQICWYHSPKSPVNFQKFRPRLSGTKFIHATMFYVVSIKPLAFSWIFVTRYCLSWYPVTLVLIFWTVGFFRMIIYWCHLENGIIALIFSFSYTHKHDVSNQDSLIDYRMKSSRKESWLELGLK